MFGEIAGSILGAGMNLIGQQQANQANADIALGNNEFNAQQARADRAFQKYMSNTAHQREIKDLKKAGLNPLLAVNGGASTPGGSTASGNMATMENELSGAVTSAIEAKQLDLAMKKQKEEVNKLKADTKLSKEQAAVANKLGQLHESNTKATKQNMTIKGPLERGTDVLNYLFDSLGNKDSKFKPKNIPRGGGLR